MVTHHIELSKAEEDSPVPIVSFLGPASSYTHQVYTLAHYLRPPWSIGLTDFDLAQAALSCFESDRYDYKPAIMITGNELNLGIENLDLMFGLRCLRSCPVWRGSAGRCPLREFY